MVEHQRRGLEPGANLRTLVVEHPERVDPGPLAGGLVQIQPGQEFLETLPVGRTAGVVAQRGELQTEAGQPERTEGLVRDRDHLRVQRGIVDADGLDAHLLQLPVSPGLRPLVPEERARVTDLHRKLTAIESVLDHRTHHPGGSLRSQRDTAATPVLEGVHLLGDDVRGFADAPGEQGRVLEDRQLDVPVSRPAGRGGDRVPYRDERGRGRRDVVGDALGRLD